MAICLDRDSLVAMMLESGEWTSEEIYYVDHLTQDRVGMSVDLVSTDKFWKEYDKIRKFAIKRLLLMRPN